MKILELLSEYESPIFKQGFVFDFYENNNDNTIKVGYRFVIQSKDKPPTKVKLTNLWMI